MAGKCRLYVSFPLFLLLTCRIANCQSNDTRTISVLYPSHSTVILPANQTTTTKTATPKPSSTSIKPPTSVHVNKSASPHSNPSKTQVPSHTTVMAPTTPGNHSTTPKTPTTKGKHSCPLCPHDDNHGKWIATGFAILFFLTTVVMTVLFCRQRKIYRELEGDSSLSRLI